MSPDQMFHALKSIAPNATLGMRRPMDWYVERMDAEISEGPILISPTERDASIPYMAIEQCWKAYSTAERVVLSAHRQNRREVRWNGYMWEDLVIRPE